MIIRQTIKKKLKLTVNNNVLKNYKHKPIYVFFLIITWNYTDYYIL